jgi:ABC-type cobalt transport system substrate-binding protein
MNFVQSKIFSRLRLSFRDSRQNGSYDVITVHNSDTESSYREWIEVVLERPKIDSILLGCQKAAGAGFITDG